MLLSMLINKSTLLQIVIEEWPEVYKPLIINSYYMWINHYPLDTMYYPTNTFYPLGSDLSAG